MPSPSLSNRFGQATGDAPVLPLLLIMTGAYLLWFGTHYWEDSKVIWPSDPVKDVLQGKGLPAHTTATTAAIELTAAESQASQATGAAGEGSGGPVTPPPVSGSAHHIAQSLLGHYGWGLSEMGPLILLWNRESGWNSHARNGTSGAFGIAQALGHGTAGTAAPDGTNEYGGYGLTDAQARAANSGDAYWQIVWGMNYIKQTYGSPSAAWAHETSAGWY